MRRIILIVSSLLLCVGALRGQDRASQAVRDMVAAIEAMGRYEVDFLIRADAQELPGKIAVEGEAYAIRMGDAEVFGDASIRYEINHARREVTLMPTETESDNLLSNPAHAFARLTQSAARLEREQEGELVIALTNPDEPLTTIFLTLQATTNLPRKIRYEMDGAGIDVVVRQLVRIEETLPRYEATQYAGYEVIDFR
ncbi:MAG: hypothetical protein E7149_03525 [Rikenellaceae bacterium]|nr:hypothetical protein [Rikenellaceae bacterium]